MFVSDKLGRKRFGGTPDKPTTPSASQDGTDDDLLDKKKAIINDEILALQIKEDELAKVGGVYIIGIQNI